MGCGKSGRTEVYREARGLPHDQQLQQWRPPGGRARHACTVLIDGDRLAELMVRHGVGVQAESSAVLHRVDEVLLDTL
jgi:hypothetical protein